MDRILKIINYLTPRADRAKHFYWGFVYMVVCTLIGRYSPIKYNVYIVLILCGLIGFIKELHDHQKRRAFD